MITSSANQESGPTPTGLKPSILFDITTCVTGVYVTDGFMTNADAQATDTSYPASMYDALTSAIDFGRTQVLNDPYFDPKNPLNQYFSYQSFTGNIAGLGLQSGDAGSIPIDLGSLTSGDGPIDTLIEAVLPYFKGIAPNESDGLKASLRDLISTAVSWGTPGEVINVVQFVLSQGDGQVLFQYYSFPILLTDGKMISTEVTFHLPYGQVLMTESEWEAFKDFPKVAWRQFRENLTSSKRTTAQLAISLTNSCSGLTLKTYTSDGAEGGAPSPSPANAIPVGSTSQWILDFDPNVGMSANMVYTGDQIDVTLSVSVTIYKPCEMGYFGPNFYKCELDTGDVGLMIVHVVGGDDWPNGDLNPTLSLTLTDAL